MRYKATISIDDAKLREIFGGIPNAAFMNRQCSLIIERFLLSVKKPKEISTVEQAVIAEGKV